MSYDDDWPDPTWENRRLMIRKTIRSATLTELKLLGEKNFPVVTDPWCLRYNEFLSNHADEKFHLAEIPEKALIVYSQDSDMGVWFLPDGKGMGIVQSKGLQILSEAVDAL